jgi:hypothetical protein
MNGNPLLRLFVAIVALAGGAAAVVVAVLVLRNSLG